MENPAGKQVVLRDMVDALCDVEDGLSDWAVEFIDSMSKWDGEYTERQVAKIEELYGRYC